MSIPEQDRFRGSGDRPQVTGQDNSSGVPFHINIKTEGQKEILEQSHAADRTLSGIFPDWVSNTLMNPVSPQASLLSYSWHLGRQEGGAGKNTFFASAQEAWPVPKGANPFRPFLKIQILAWLWFTHFYDRDDVVSPITCKQVNSTLKEKPTQADLAKDLCLKVGFGSSQAGLIFQKIKT